MLMGILPPPHTDIRAKMSLWPATTLTAKSPKALSAM